MAKKAPQPMFDFLAADVEERKEKGQACAHQRESRTLTVWPGENFERMTMTCDDCGHIRGRYPNE